MPPYTTRRNFLKTGLLSGQSAPFISACGCGISSAFASEETPDDLTTLTRVLVPGEYLSKGKLYRCIAVDNGWPIVVREDLSEAKPERESRRRPLVSFAHVADLHIIDAASPSHSSFLRQYIGNINGAPLSNAARPQDTLTVHVLDAMVRRINAIGKGPISGRIFDFAISTGDNADSRGLHEFEAVIAVLNGEKTVSTPLVAAIRVCRTKHPCKAMPMMLSGIPCTSKPTSMTTFGKGLTAIRWFKALLMR